MIAGLVTADREAVVQLTVRGPTGVGRRIDAVIDTGYDGWLSLPPGLIVQMRLPWRRRGSATLADGRDISFNIYEGTVVWDRRSRRIPIDEADTIPLVGMALLEGNELNMQVRANGKVTIKRLPRRQSP